MNPETEDRILQALEKSQRGAGASEAQRLLFSVLAGLMLAGVTGLVAAAVTWGSQRESVRTGVAGAELARQNSLTLARLETAFDGLRQELSMLPETLADIRLKAEAGALDRFTETQAVSLENRLRRDLEKEIESLESRLEKRLLREALGDP